MVTMPADQEIFIWRHKNQLIGIIACFINIRDTFKIGSESLEAFSYLGLNIIRNTDFSISVKQTNFINAINTVLLTNDMMKCTSVPFWTKREANIEKYRLLN